MAELQLDESEPEDLETRSEEVVPPLPWETHPVTGKHRLEVISSVPEVIRGSEARDIRERSQFGDDDGGEIEVDIPDVAKCSRIDACDLTGAVHSSQIVTTIGSLGYMADECEASSEDAEREEDCCEVFTADVAEPVMENATILHETKSAFLPEVEDLDRTQTESPQNLNNASDVLLQEEAEMIAAEADIVRVSITREVEPPECDRCHESSVARRVAAAEVVDDTSHPVRSGEVTSSVASTELSAAVSNQNIELNQNILGASLVYEPTNDGSNLCVKNNKEDSKNEDELNRNFDVKESHHKSRTTDDLPPSVKSKQRHVGHLVLDELTPTNSRRSYRSKRKHLNSSSSGKHGDSRKRGDNRTAGGEEPFESNPSSVERKRQSEVLDSVTEDSSLFIPSSGDWHEVNSEGECRDAIARKSSYLRAVKVSSEYRTGLMCV